MTIYLDHASTTPVRREVVDAMLPLLTEHFGNPSSAHAYGRRARASLDEAHERLATRLNVGPREIVFTSGGTEANNLALKGAAWAGKARGHRIVTSSVEHHAVGHTLRYLEKFGFEIVEVPVDRYGRVDPDQLEDAITDRTILVSVMLANNEVGTIQPIAEIAARIQRRRGIVMHVDAVQAAAYVDLDLATLGADLVSLAAHKFEGPKGIGALYVRHGTHLLAQEHGGSQERHRRAGTEMTGHPRDRLPGLLSIVARGTDGNSVALALDLEGIATSVGSACATGSPDVSHVLAAMGYPDEEARGALRISLGRTTTATEVEVAAVAIPRTLAAHRSASAGLTDVLLGTQMGA